MEKNIQKIKIKNQLELWAFCAVIGTVAGALVWALLKIMASGTEIIWEWIPERIHIPYYTVLVCTVGGAIIGIFRKLYGDYPEDMETVMGKVKKEKRYEYKNMLVMMIAALLPLLIGSSVGPEAGLTGIIVGLCYWAGENLKFAKQHTKEYSQIGAAVSLSVLFHAPLFGIFEVEEDPDMQLAELGRGSKIFIYGIALAAGTGSYAGLSALLGGGMSGFPSFDIVAVQRIDYVMMLVYMFCGCVLAYFYETTHTVTGIIAGKIPGVVKEILAGLCLGVVGMLIPAVMFSGEEQMGVLMKEYAGYMAIALIGVAFLKIILTNLCIQFGLKGGHFFPVIFAGVCLGYGLAMLFFGQQGDSHV
ncbi:chloride channel protein, partial [Dorea longicatena]|uniref:chloride channel protein n=1 Tax=Dorea longicatena TaxID=88431 RepID=UPI0011063AB7